MGPLVGPVSRAVLGIALFLCGFFQFSIAQIMGPGNSDELVGDGPVLIPWFGLPVAAMLLAGGTIVFRRRAIAPWVLGVGAACAVAWFVLASVV